MQSAAHITATEIDKLFRRAWVEKGKTFAQMEAALASLLGVSTRTIANYRNGTSEVTAEQWEVISQYFHGIMSNSEQA